MNALEAWAEIQQQWSATATPIALTKHELKAYIVALKSSMDNNTSPPSIALTNSQVQQIKDLLSDPQDSSLLGGSVSANINLKL